MTISSLVGWGGVIGSSILVLVFAVVISILVEWGVVTGSPILVWGPAVATLSIIGWGKYSYGGGGLGGIAYGEG